jgi:putative phage-type endonuclease
MATIPQDRQAFLMERRQGLGGSDMAAIMGLSPWKSPMDVFLDKIGETPEASDTDAMYWGTRLEDLVAREFARQTGYKVQRRNTMLRHPTIPYLIGHVDRIVTSHPGGPAVLEAKTTSVYRKADWADGQAPLPYVIQVQHYLDLTGYRTGYLAVLIGGRDFRIVPVEPNDDLIRQMHEAADAFWLCVETRTPPVVDGSVATAKALAALYPADSGMTIPLPADAAIWIIQREQAKAALTEVEAKITEAENHLKALLGDARSGQIGQWRVDWDTRTRRTLDTQALRAAHPDLAAAYEKTTTYRHFTIKEVW